MVKYLSSDIPTSDRVFIDTNVLILVHKQVPMGSMYTDRQKVYSKTINELLKKDKALITTWLNVAEVFNVLERMAMEEYRITVKADESFTIKDFRKLVGQRERLQKEILQVYSEIAYYYTVKDAKFIRKWMDKFAVSYTTHHQDPSDYVMSAFIEREGISEIITDDHDFHSDARFTVYTY